MTSQLQYVTTCRTLPISKAKLSLATGSVDGAREYPASHDEQFGYQPVFGTSSRPET